MKKTGIINAELMRQIAALGHMELFLIGDAGMPVPKGVPIIDLALCRGVPSFEAVLAAVLAETQVEFYYLAEEIHRHNPALLTYIEQTMSGIPCETMSHSRLKRLTESCKFAIRTGEYSPYPNVVLRSGVTF